MSLKTLLFYFLILLAFNACGKPEEKPTEELTQEMQEPQTTQESQQDSNKTKESEQETPLQKELKQNLKAHLNQLSKELQEKDLNSLQIEKDTAMQKHMDYFQGFHGRKDLPKGNPAQNAPHLILDKAYLLQQTQIEKLQQKNDEISK